MYPAFAGREDLLVELIRALVALGGRQVTVTIETPHGCELLRMEGALTRRFRQPLESDVITLGFHVDAQRIDLHLTATEIADLSHFQIDQGQSTALRLQLEDGATIQIKERPPTP